MIESFLSSWPLFYQSYLPGWLISFLLSMVGVIVVARDQIFIGAAVSQTSTLGIALMMWATAILHLDRFSWFRPDLFFSGMAVIFSIAAAFVTGRGGEMGRESHEAITGWVFLVSASFSILIVSHSPHGLEEIYRLLSSSIVGATLVDVWVFSVLTSLTVSFLALFYPKILLFALDRSMAVAVGMKLEVWNAVISVWLGLAVGLSIRASGMLFTFGCLVLPALVAKNLCRQVRSMFFLAPMIGVGTGILGFSIANHHDYPPGQLTVALYCLELMAAWGVRRFREAA